VFRIGYKNQITGMTRLQAKILKPQFPHVVQVGLTPLHAFTVQRWDYSS
jgi:hypothetical protein